LFYVGEDVHLRVPPRRIELGEKMKIISYGYLYRKIPIAEGKEIIEKAVSTIAPFLKIIHEYKGTFTEYYKIAENFSPTVLSSFGPGNVALSG